MARGKSELVRSTLNFKIEVSTRHGEMKGWKPVLVLRKYCTLRVLSKLTYSVYSMMNGYSKYLSTVLCQDGWFVVMHGSGKMRSQVDMWRNCTSPSSIALLLVENLASTTKLENLGPNPHHASSLPQACGQLPVKCGHQYYRSAAIPDPSIFFFPFPWHHPGGF